MPNTNNSNTRKNESVSFIADMLEYKHDIAEALTNPTTNSERIFKNDDRSKNAMIMSVMFDNCDEVTMYCGEMSVFRKSFYREIDKICEGAGGRALGEVKNSLNHFLRNNHKLTIVLEHFKDSYLEDLISDQIKESKSVCLRIVNKDRLWTSVLSHTALGKKHGNIVIRRRELNFHSRSARCLVNPSPDAAEESNKLMSYILEASSPIDIKR